MVNTNGINTAITGEKAKRNLASWIRKTDHLREPGEIAAAIKPGYDFLTDCIYRSNFEGFGYFYKFVTQTPEEVL